MDEQPKPLTLAECLGQPRGTEGRLFKAPQEVKEIRGPYRVVKKEGERIDVEYYYGRGQVVQVTDLPLTQRAQDIAMSSTELMDGYVSVGRAAAATQTLFR